MMSIRKSISLGGIILFLISISFVSSKGKTMGERADENVKSVNNSSLYADEYDWVSDFGLGNYFDAYIHPFAIERGQATSANSLLHMLPSGGQVTVQDDGSTVYVTNGTVSFRIQKSNATMVSLKYNGVNMLGGDYSGGKLYYVWVLGRFQTPSHCTYSLDVDPSTNGGQFAELRFHMDWNHSSDDAPVDVDIYFSLKAGEHQVYTSMMMHHPKSYPQLSSGQISVTSYVNPDVFDWITVDSLRNFQIPSESDMQKSVPVDGAPKEVTRITTGPYEGRYECKYNYSSDLGKLDVWGWSSSSDKYGIWMTVPSHEYYNAGPLKNELTSHETGALLNCVGATHYGMGGDGTVPAGEDWRKIYGPYSVYMNHMPNVTSGVHDSLWHEAIQHAKEEQQKWPYDWYTNPYYKKENKRGTITGKLVVSDPGDSLASGANKWVGAIIPPPSVQGFNNSFQLWSKGYQFWTKTDSSGNFTIPNVIASDTAYNLYAFGTGSIGKMVKELYVNVDAGKTTDVGNVSWTPERKAPTVWEIGVPNRTAQEFKDGLQWWDPDDYPSTHWGRFLNYYKEFPDNEINYTIGKSDWSKDWYFVQPYYSDSTNSSPVWTVNFNLTKDPKANSTAALYISYASHFMAATIIKVNGTLITPSSGFIPSDRNDAMIRLAIHGAWSEHWFTFPSKLLKAGQNKITFEQRITGGSNHSSNMFDYIRLEAEGTKATTRNLQEITFDSIDRKFPEDSDFVLQATASSGLRVHYESSNPSVATVDNGLVHIVGEGTTMITASQPGDSLWLPAEKVTREFRVRRKRKEQKIDLGSIPNQYLGQSNFKMPVKASSGLPITYTSNNPEVAIVKNGALILKSVGPVSITAKQPGDSIWSPAQSVKQSFYVKKANNSPKYNKLLTPNGDGINDRLVIKSIDYYKDNELLVYDRNGKLIYHKKNYDNRWNGRTEDGSVLKGTYYIVLKSEGNTILKGTVTVIYK